MTPAKTIPSALALPFMALAALLLTAPPAPAQSVDGKAAYDRRCARCHTVAQALDYMRPHTEAAARVTWLDEKLATHYARDAKDRAAIVAFLEEMLAAEGGKADGKTGGK